MQIVGSASPVFAQTEKRAGDKITVEAGGRPPSLSCCKSRQSGTGEILKENFNESYK